MNTFKNFKAILTFIFTGDSPLVECMDIWLRWANVNDYRIKVWHENDALLFAKILYHIDDRIQDFFSSCVRARVADDVDYKLLDFSDIKSEMKSKVISYFVPEVIKNLAIPQVEKKRAFQHQPSYESDKADNSSKKPKAGARKKVQVVNNNMDDSINKKARANYNLFKNKFKDLPKIENVSICGHYHLMGRCTMGKDCHRQETHRDLSSTEMNTLKAWVESVDNSAGSN